MPVPYDARLHEKAQKTQDYAPLSRDIPLQTAGKGGWVIVEIPALEPWGMLVISKNRVPNKSDAGDSE